MYTLHAAVDKHSLRCKNIPQGDLPRKCIKCSPSICPSQESFAEAATLCAGMPKGVVAVPQLVIAFQVLPEGGTRAAVGQGRGVGPVAAHTPGVQIQKTGR